MGAGQHDRIFFARYGTLYRSDLGRRANRCIGAILEANRRSRGILQSQKKQSGR
jgi:hypothetical protein